VNLERALGSVTTRPKRNRLLGAKPIGLVVLCTTIR
jgi:hypothetical protein